MKKIESPNNENFKRWLQLVSSSKSRKKLQQYILSGRKTIPEYLEAFNSGHPFSNKKTMEVILTEEQLQQISLPLNSKESLTFLKKYILPHHLFSQLDIFGTNYPLLCISTPSLPSWSPHQPPKGIEVLCAMGDPGNLGGLIRVATAFSVSKIILLTEAASPFHPKTLRGASGTLLNAPLYLGPSLNALMKDSSIISLSMQGEEISQFTWPSHCRLLIGEEGPGLGALQIGRSVKIPMKKGVESLNALSAASIALYLATSSASKS